MCKNLAELLQAEQPLFSIKVEQLERASGRPSIDVRLLAEIIGKEHMRTKALGLDPHDTNGPELYHALQDLVGRHDSFIAERLGAKDREDVTEVLQLIQPFIEKLDIPNTAWVLKSSVAKRLLKQSPPRQVMKHLHYRSIDSMLKRENIGEIYGSLRFGESAAWQQKFFKSYSSLTPMDFEVRKIEIITLDSKKWQGLVEDFVKTKRNNIMHLKELGVVLILPLPVGHLKGISITALAKVLHAVNEIRLFSSYIKLQQVSKQFGVKVQKSLRLDPEHVVAAGHNVPWRSVHGHFIKHTSAKHMELFEPHLQLEDLEWRKVEEILYKIEPALHFWHDMDFVAALRDKELVSFNLIDNVLSYVNKLAYKDRLTANFKHSLTNEMMIRYVGQPPMENLVVERLGVLTAQDHMEFAV